MRWISVNDRLPEPQYGPVLIWDGNYVQEGFYTVKCWYTADGDYPFGEVSHWADMPPPPTGVSSDE